MEDTKEEIEVSIFPGSASEDNSKIIDSVREEIEEKEKEKISCEKNITTKVRRTPKPRKFDDYVTYMCIEIIKLDCGSINC